VKILNYCMWNHGNKSGKHSYALYIVNLWNTYKQTIHYWNKCEPIETSMLCWYKKCETTSIIFKLIWNTPNQVKPHKGFTEPLRCYINVRNVKTPPSFSYLWNTSLIFQVSQVPKRSTCETQSYSPCLFFLFINKYRKYFHRFLLVLH
jgi:hypothetical protein